MPEERRRRTERLFLRYPVRVEGTDALGKVFGETTHTIVVNRHGGRILLKALVTPGQSVTIAHVTSGRSAEFRVVGLAAPPTSSGGEWGVECRDEELNFWGISFPPMDESMASSSVLWECPGCLAVALTGITMVEYDLLESTGSLLTQCWTCMAETQWTSALNPARVPQPVSAPVAEAAAASTGGPLAGPPVPTLSAPAPMIRTERRAAHRVSLRLPIRVRSAQDMTELTKSENVSKCGFAFTSDKIFEPGETLLVTCPYTPSGENIEVRGRVVRREEVAGTGRYLYGVEYQK